MALLEKLEIRGIRSFSPLQEQVLSFSTPVTLLLGQNGCGKTTVIESIKYCCTGELPANTDRGSGFINDPTILDQQYTKACIKCQFIDHNRDKFIIGRFIQVSLSRGKSTFKSINQQIHLCKAGTKDVVDITGRCVDINSFCTEKLNVSPAILNNVLFCHQENASWPLDESSKLKEKFDQIFDAVRYNKCVDSFRVMIKKQGEKIRMLKLEVKHKAEMKQIAENLIFKIDVRKENYKKAENSIKEIENSLEPINKRITEILELENTLSKKQSALTAKVEQKRGFLNEQNRLREQIISEFEGTDEELNEIIQSFEEERKKEEKSVEELETTKVSLDEKLKELADKAEIRNTKICGLKEEHKQHEKKCEERKNLIEKTRAKLQLNSTTDIDSPTLSKNVIEELKNTHEIHQCAFEDMIVENEAEEVNLQKEIDNIREKHVSTKSNIVSKNKTIQESNKKLRELSEKLEELSHSDDILKSVTDKIENVESQLESLNKNFDERQKNKEIDAISEEIKNIEREIEKLEKDYKILQQNHVNEEMAEKENESIIEKKSKISKLKSKHADNFEQIFGSKMPNKDFNNKVQGMQENYDTKLKSLNETINALEKKITTYETEIKHKNKQLNNHENDLQNKRKNVEQVCKGKEFNSLLDTTFKLKERLQKERGQLSSAKVMYETFIDQFKRDSPCCPVCKTDFTNKEKVVNEVISQLKNNIEKLPSQLKNIEANLKNQESLFNKMQQLKPVNDEITELSDEKIPSLKQEIIEYTEKLVQCKKELAEARKESSLPAKNLEVISKMLTDTVLLDQYISDISESEKNLANLYAKIIVLESNKSRQEVEADIDNLKGQISNLSNKKDTDKKKLDSHKTRCEQLKNDRQKYMERKLKVQEGFQEKPHLERQKKEIEASLSKIKEEVEKLKIQEGILEKELEEATLNKKTFSENNKKTVNEERKKLQVNNDLIQDIIKVQKIIDNYLKKDQVEVIKVEEELLEKLKQKQESINVAKNKVGESIVSKKEQLAKSVSTYRSLKDNLLLRESHREELRVDEEIEELKDQIGDSNYKSIDNEKRKLAHSRDKINREINTLEGQKEEIEKTIRELQKELNEPNKKNAVAEYRKKYYETKIAELVNTDLQKYCIELEASIMQFHKDRMVQINKTIRDLWRQIYRGNDIDYIQITTEIGTSTAKKRVYNYKVMQVQKGTEIEMRGRCSAGQRVLACLVIRMALAETFSAHCGILALDEPTTNLDKPNILSLSDTLVRLIETRKSEKNFQLIIITHDEEFLNTLTRSMTSPHYLKVSKNNEGFSTVQKVTL